MNFLIKIKAIFQNLRLPWVVTVIFLVLLVGGVFTVWRGHQTEKELRSQVLTTIRTIAAAIHPEQLKRLPGTPEDTALADYHSIRNQLIRMNNANPDIRWLYFMKKTEKGFLFTLDNVPVDTFGHTEPGKVYYEDPPSELHHLLEGTNAETVGPYTDEWGTFVSGFAVVSDPLTGETIQLLALDIDATKWQELIRNEQLQPIAITLLIALLLALFHMIQNRTKQSTILLRKRNQEILDFTTVITHDLKKPLQTLNMIHGMWQKCGIQPDPALYEDMQTTCQAALNQMKELLEDILSTVQLQFSNKECLNKESVLILPLLSEIRDLLKYQINEKKADVTIIADADMALSANRKSLEKMFINLLGNALNYSHPDRTPKIVIKVTAENGGFLFSVADNGLGIPDKDKQAIFNQFYRGSNVQATSGTGLGLFIIRSSVEIHGGRIWLESEEGQGTTFFFSIPLR
ncbi:MAG: hypothetical protein A2293_14240 [Elusimicrobia bacterium RIFOXYB2_FULL_49_7]|nr:MAG: hypothetical protein A2293_14240 [Elusimicrobia bacterium RIFOXYB2_FULL_49_7]